jgi:putative sigma-54 modulation protein
MKIDIHGHRIEVSETFRAHIERRLRFALGRFGTRVTTVTVTLEDLNGPRGGIDKQCRIAVTLASAGHLRVEVMDTEITPAVDQAADRIGRAVAREFERHHSYPTYRPSTFRIAGPGLFQRQSRSMRQHGAA